jgi:glutathione S-transferase
MTIARLTISHFPATRSARVLWAAYEAVGEREGGPEIVVDPVNLYGNAQHQPEFLAINPNHNVPVLRIGWSDGREQVMLESGAMILFLADAFPESGLAPPPGASSARADYLYMMQFGGSPMDMMLWQVRIHEHIIPEDERDVRTIVRYRAKFAAEVEPQLAARLSAHDFICGDDFTAADCMIGHNVTWARGYGMCQDPLFRAYLSRLSKRPAFQKAFADASNFSPKPPETKPGRERVKFSG